MIIKSKLFLTFFSAIFSLNIFAQTTENSYKDLKIQEHHKNEIGISYSPVYLLKEKVFSSGLHIHYVHNIQKSKFGIGVGYERIFEKHKHNTFGLEATYIPIEQLNFSLSPGLAFEDNNSKVNFALHLETSYEFEIKEFHIGPAFEFAYHPEDFHISLGIHVGYGF
jgi:hypothetical protein